MSLIILKTDIFRKIKLCKLGTTKFRRKKRDILKINEANPATKKQQSFSRIDSVHIYFCHQSKSKKTTTKKT